MNAVFTLTLTAAEGEALATALERQEFRCRDEGKPAAALMAVHLRRILLAASAKGYRPRADRRPKHVILAQQIERLRRGPAGFCDKLGAEQQLVSHAEANSQARTRYLSWVESWVVPDLEKILLGLTPKPAGTGVSLDRSTGFWTATVDGRAIASEFTSEGAAKAAIDVERRRRTRVAS